MSGPVAEVGTVNNVTVSGITKLNGKNFRTWKEMIGIVLQLRGLSKAITMEQVEETINLQAKLALLESMDESHRAQVMGCQTAREVMSRLELIYADNSSANVYRLMHRYYRYKKAPEDSMSIHIGKMEELKLALIDIDKKPDEELYQVTLLGSLPPEYESMMEVWELTHPSMRTTANLISRLLKREEDLKMNADNHQALAVGRMNPEAWKKLPIEEKKKLTKCKNCGKKGHWARECKMKKEPEEPNQSKTEEKNETKEHVLFNLGDTSIDAKDKWVIDSGATAHMCRNKNWFIELIMYPSSVTCSVGDGSQVKVLGIGKIEVQTGVVSGVFTEVLYIPSLSTNLVSVGAAARQGIDTIFKGERCQMIKNKVPIAEGKRIKDNLYILEIKVLVKNNTALYMNCERSLSEWHRALGHANKERIIQLAQDTESMKITGGNDIPPCSNCAEGKGKCVSHPRKEESAIKVGEKVCIDLSGKVNKISLAGSQYYLLCKDEYSEFTYVQFAKDKGMIHELLAKTIIEFEEESGQTIRKIHTDQGSEFTNRNVELLLIKERIKHETSAVYTPQQNGVIEREMGIVTGMARAMLSASRLTLDLWEEAIRAAVYLKNRLPTKKSRQTPYERFIGRKPTVEHIVEFGTEVHIIKKGEHMYKFDKRTEHGWVVGYTRRRNTYRVYLKESKRVIETCEVIMTPHNTVVAIETDPEPKREEEGMTLKFETLQNPDNAPENQNTAPRASGTNEEERERQSKLLETFFEEFRAENGVDVSSLVEPIDVDQTQRRIQERELPPIPTNEIHVQPITNHRMLLSTVEVRIPETFVEAVTGSMKEEWKKAIKNELEAHEENGTWEIVDRKPEYRLLKARWVFTLKRDKQGNIERFKARLVAKGYNQREGLDYKETYAPVTGINSIRTLLALCASQGWTLEQFDVTTAFLNGILEEEVYLELPDGVKALQRKCLRLVKALYGLKQAPKAWYGRLKSTMTQLGFKQLETDICVFTNSQTNTHVAVYVDDGLVIGSNHEMCTQVIKDLNQQFKTKLVKTEVFLGMELTKHSNKITLSQSTYIDEMIRRFQLQDAHGKSSPSFEVKEMFQLEEDTKTLAPYRELIGSLQYCANHTRPDILFPVNFLARFNQDPHEKHWKAARSILRYLKATRDYKIEYTCGGLEITAYSDSDLANDPQDRRSISGGLVMMSRGPIIFLSKKQTIVGLSSTEVEYVAACEVARELAWLTQFLSELKVRIERPPTIYIDNQSTIKQITNGDTNKNNKHVDIKYHYVRNALQDRLFELRYVNTDKQVADYLTKNLNGNKLKELVNLSGIRQVGPQNKKSTMGRLSNVSLLLVGLLALGAMCDGIKFQRAEPAIWIPSSYHVDIGVNYYNIEYTYTNPCDALSIVLGVKTEHSKYDFKRESVKRFEELCHEEYQKGWKPKLEEFEQCESKQDGWFKRAKR